ncbi:hypothetical protein [Streptomyces sp. NPDC006333]|uniref:hypothetical protein n=1 Tax=Streptomyces sp. NPDC006333 TaxID=3156753 RepID=UPI00339FB92A
MLARPRLTITITPNAAPLPLLGGAVASLPYWSQVPQRAAYAVGFLVAFRVRVRLMRRAVRA